MVTSGEANSIAYRDAHEAMLSAFPELAPCHRRLVEDWDDFGGEPPGQYIVLPDVLGTFLEVLLGLPPATRGRDELLRRVFALGEAMLASRDEETRSLAIDWLCETAQDHPRGKRETLRLGGSHARSWFEHRGSDPLLGLRSDPIDLWGVREIVASLLPTLALADLPGTTSHDINAEPSLEAVQRGPNGVVLLGTFGLAHLYVVSLADQVHCSEPALTQLARDLCLLTGGEEPHGQPSAGFRRIPPGERVWNMRQGEEEHGRLGETPWVHERFTASQTAILEVLAQRRARLRGSGAPS